MNLEEKMRRDLVAEYEGIIQDLGLDPQDPNLKETPDRAAKALMDICYGLKDTKKRAKEILSKRFPATYDEMVVVAGIECTGLCPHHFLPIDYEVMVGYIPKEECVGLSKLSRLVELLAARPVMQETLTHDIAGYIEQSLYPMGIGVKVVGVHGCMVHRGVHQRHAETITTTFVGSIKDLPSSRAEFLSYWK